MFTGIITHIAKIQELNSKPNSDLEIALEINDKIERKLEIGCSISCSGACLTLTKKEENLLFFEASNETLSKTTIKNWKIGNEINLEFALRMGDELGGHMVSGHVDKVAKILSIKPANQDSTIFDIEIPKDLVKFITTKGSIVLNGVSLTINQVFDNSFNVNIISHTLQNTNFRNLKLGDYLNLEIDLIARYLEKLTK
ncbi:MAG: riboflavin synthase [Lentimonas sp.]|jgi:riboflavin synthase